MATVTVSNNWLKIEQNFLLTPKDLVNNTRQLFNGELRNVKALMVANVSGAILNRKSGKLAKSIKSRVRVFNGTRVWGRAGSKYYIGRFHEYGFNRRGKTYPPKMWATPVVAQALPRISQMLEATISQTLASRGF